MSAEEKFLKAYEDHADAIFRHCFFRLSQDRERALDIMQETFTKTWAYIARGNTIENLRAFLYKTATHLIIDGARKKESLSLDKLKEEGFDPGSNEESRIVSGAEFAQLEKLFLELEHNDRDVLIMRYLDDLSPKEIASILDVSENVVSVRIHRAIKKIREFLS